MKRDSKPKWSAPPPQTSNPFGEFFRDELGHEGAAEVAAEDTEAQARSNNTAKDAGWLRGQTAVVALDRKGRKGKTVTLVKGIYRSPMEMEDLARRLRQACGAGGTLDGDTIEIQGDQRERVEALLASLGARVKRSGG